MPWAPLLLTVYPPLVPEGFSLSAGSDFGGNDRVEEERERETARIVGAELLDILEPGRWVEGGDALGLGVNNLIASLPLWCLYSGGHTSSFAKCSSTCAVQTSRYPSLRAPPPPPPITHCSPLSPPQSQKCAALLFALSSLYSPLPLPTLFNTAVFYLYFI